MKQRVNQLNSTSNHLLWGGLNSLLKAAGTLQSSSCYKRNYRTLRITDGICKKINTDHLRTFQVITQNIRQNQHRNSSPNVSLLTCIQWKLRTDRKSIYQWEQELWMILRECTKRNSERDLYFPTLCKVKGENYVMLLWQEGVVHSSTSSVPKLYNQRFK